MEDADAVSAEAARVLGVASVPHILDIVCRTTGMGFAAIARVTPSRWITCASLDHLKFGLNPGDELPVESTICHEVRGCGQRIVIDDVAGDPHWREHHTPRTYGFRSYISVPIVLGDGSFFGTLCAIDPNPRLLDEPRTLSLFESFASLLGREIDSLAALERNRVALDEARESVRLRDRSLAVLAHDLRTPLASLMAGVRILRRDGDGDGGGDGADGRGAAGAPGRGGEITGLMQSSLERMAELVETLLDLARSTMGGGIPVEIEPCETLVADIGQIVDETRAARGREIAASLDIAGPVACDRQRVCQLVANLLDNAIAHGASDTPVSVEATRLADGDADGDADGAGERVFRLSVVNGGRAIPDAIRETLFQPFVHAEGEAEGQGQGQGLGLGLYIADQIARAHGGTLSVDSDETRTRFTFEMPLA